MIESTESIMCSRIQTWYLHLYLPNDELFWNINQNDFYHKCSISCCDVILFNISLLEDNPVVVHSFLYTIILPVMWHSLAMPWKVITAIKYIKVFILKLKTGFHQHYCLISLLIRGWYRNWNLLVKNLKYLPLGQGQDYQTTI